MRIAAHAADATDMLSWRKHSPARFSVELRRNHRYAAQVCTRSVMIRMLEIPFPEELLAAVNQCAT